mmetsp:Transcript_20717/g.57306  ORF Transcript_20717/g.57306 Transcript_20717/m.57306 type:complete len:226 (+) Transcript_20717:1061-1738(+)
MRGQYQADPGGHVQFSLTRASEGLRRSEVVAGEAQGLAERHALHKLHVPRRRGSQAGSAREHGAGAHVLRETGGVEIAPAGAGLAPVDGPERCGLSRLLGPRDRGEDAAPHRGPVEAADLPACGHGAQHEDQDHGGHREHELEPIRRLARNARGGDDGEWRVGWQGAAGILRAWYHEGCLQLHCVRVQVGAGQVRAPGAAAREHRREVGRLPAEAHHGREEAAAP